MREYRREEDSALRAVCRAAQGQSEIRKPIPIFGRSPTPLLETTDEELAREQVVDCAVAWAACPDEHNARDLRAAVAILRQADGSDEPSCEDETAQGEPLSTYQRQVLADYYWGR